MSISSRLVGRRQLPTTVELGKEIPALGTSSSLIRGFGNSSSPPVFAISAWAGVLANQARWITTSTAIAAHRRGLRGAVSDQGGLQLAGTPSCREDLADQAGSASPEAYAHTHTLRLRGSELVGRSSWTEHAPVQNAGPRAVGAARHGQQLTWQMPGAPPSA